MYRYKGSRNLEGSGSLCICVGEYTYDALSRSTSESATDGAGNSYEYGANNSITSVNGVQLETDECGNTLHYIQDGKKLDVVYDAKNRIHQIGGDENQYHYDVENNRVSMSSQGISMTYTYDTSGGRNRLVWMEDQDSQGTVFVYGADGLMWSKSDGEYKIYHYDYRGSVVAVTDENGNLTDEIRYNAYGSVVGRTGTDLLIIGYNGRDGVLTEPNGLLFMRARYYSPALKRFMNADIILGSIADPSTLNLYAYVNGNPISYVDPFGLSKEESSNGGIEWMPNIDPLKFISWIPSFTEIENRWKIYMQYGFSLLKVQGKPFASFVGEIPKGMENVLSNDYLYFLIDELGDLRPLVDPKAAGREAIKLFQDSGLSKACDALMLGQIALNALGHNLGSAYLSAAAGAKIGAILGTPFPGPGNAIGAIGGFAVGFVIDYVANDFKVNDTSLLDLLKDGVG